MVAAPTASRPIFSIRELSVEFDTDTGTVHAANAVNYDVFPGETLAIVGETGSGKTVTVLAALGLLMSENGRISNGSVRFDDHELLTAPDRELRRLLGKEIAMVFQDPTSALNPVVTVGRQIAEVLRVHDRGLSKSAARGRVIDLLSLVGIPQPEIRWHHYPHQFSGGMCQRAVIAMAIANGPRVLIADEPTTGLDVTVQAQLLELLKAAQQETGAATILITHDLGVVAEIADRVCVMYAGRVVETGSVRALFAQPRHPYTIGLLSCLPRLDIESEFLVSIPGQPPDLSQPITGCPFAPRCDLSAGRSRCTQERPELVAPSTARGQSSACHFSDEVPEWHSSKGMPWGASFEGTT